MVVDNHTIDDSLAVHGWDATKRAQHGQGPISVQRYASRTRRRLLTDTRAAVQMSQETVVRIRHDPEPLLPVAEFMQACIGGGTPGVRANDGVEKGESCMNSYEFVRIHAYGSATGLPGFATFRFGRRLGMLDAFGAGLPLDDAHGAGTHSIEGKKWQENAEHIAQDIWGCSAFMLGKWDSYCRVDLGSPSQNFFRAPPARSAGKPMDHSYRYRLRFGGPIWLPKLPSIFPRDFKNFQAFFHRFFVR